MTRSRQSIFVRFINEGGAELVAGAVLVAVSLPMSTATFNNVTAEVLMLATILFLPSRYPVALIPSALVMGLALSGNIDHLLLTGFTVYLAIEYAVAISKKVTAGALFVLWLITAYGIEQSEVSLSNTIQALAMELVFLLLAVAVGYFRLRSARERSKQVVAQHRLNHELRTSLARYLHDSVARSLTMMTNQAEVTEIMTDDPESREQVKVIADTGRVAISDLKQLVDHLIESNPQDSATMLGVWQTASVRNTVETTVNLLESAGYDVTCDPVTLTQRLPRRTETAFALAFNEVAANLVKHSASNSRVEIAVVGGDDCMDVSVVNEQKAAGKKLRTASVRKGIGLESIAKRMREIGGDAHLETGNGVWKVTLSLPIEPEN